MSLCFSSLENFEKTIEATIEGLQDFKTNKASEVAAVVSSRNASDATT